MSTQRDNTVYVIILLVTIIITVGYMVIANFSFLDLGYLIVIIYYFLKFLYLKCWR